MSALPKFRLNKPTMTAEAFQAEIENKPRYVGPGQYDFKVVAVSDQKANTMDPSWVDVRVKLENSVGEIMTSFLKIPTESLSFKSAYPMLAIKELVNFFGALGESFTPQNAQELLTKYVGADFTCKKLVGKTFSATVGYSKNYINYVSKDTYSIVDKNGYEYKDDKGEKLKYFNTRDEAKAFAKDNNIKLQDFIQILKYETAETTASDEVTDDATGDDFGF